MAREPKMMGRTGAITPVQRYQSTDGREFNTLDEADQHEQGLARVAAISKVVARFHHQEMSMDVLVNCINDNMADLIAAFRNQDNI